MKWIVTSNKPGRSMITTTVVECARATTARRRAQARANWPEDAEITVSPADRTIAEMVTQATGRWRSPNGGWSNPNS